MKATVIFKTPLAVLYIFICTCFLPSEARNKHNGGPDHGNIIRQEEYYLINPSLPSPLIIRLENDSIMHLLVNDSTDFASKSDVSEEWLSYRREDGLPVLRENITRQFCPESKTSKNKSALLHKWANVGRITNYHMDSHPLNPNDKLMSINGNPIIRSDFGNPYLVPQAGSRKFEDYVAEHVLAYMFPEEVLQLGVIEPNGERIFMEINQDVLRIEYIDNELGTIVEKYAIDLRADLVSQNPIIHIGPMIYSTRDNIKSAIGKKAFELSKRKFPTLEGEDVILLYLFGEPFSRAFVKNFWLIRSESEILKNAKVHIDFKKMEKYVEIYGTRIPMPRFLDFEITAFPKIIQTY